jgi:hypothetical protein
MVGEGLNVMLLVLLGAISLLAVGFWVVVLGGIVLNRPVFEDILEDDTDR